MNRTFSIFLLYVCVMLIITFLQQEFVLLPELQNLDIVGEETKVGLLEQYQKLRWIAFLIVPLVLAIRLSLISLCLFIGSFFFMEMGGKQYKDWWKVATMAQLVMLVYSVTLCLANIIYGANTAMTINKYTSLLFLTGDSNESWTRLPLAALNIFEVLYWLVLAVLVMRLCRTSFKKSFRCIMSSYGVGYLFYIAFLMFLMLYLT